MEDELSTERLIMWSIVVVEILLIGFMFWHFNERINHVENYLGGSDWVCDKIFYIYPGDKHPEVFANTNYRSPLLQPPVQSEFCTEVNSKTGERKCIFDYEADAYDDYCIEWKLVKAPKDQHMRIPWMYSYMKNMTLTNGTNTFE